MSIRPVSQISKAQPTLEGAGVKLHRAFGFGDPSMADPFLLFDDFRNDRPEDFLKGFPWHQLQPEVILCEFEDRKTLPRGITWKDKAEFLQTRGYFVYVSEWWPITEYGLKHDWRGLYEYRTDLRLGPNAWGNLLAFSQDPGLITLLAIAEETKTVNETAAKSAGRSNRNYLSSVAIAVDLATRKWPKLHRVLSSAYRRLQRLENPKSADGGV